MRIQIIITFILLGCFGCVSNKLTTEKNHLSFRNYSEEDAKLIYYIKTNEEDKYSEGGRLYPAKYYSSMASGFSTVTTSPNENFYKVEYFLSDKLIGVREYTRKELLVEKQGIIAINKRGKIKK